MITDAALLKMTELYIDFTSMSSLFILNLLSLFCSDTADKVFCDISFLFEIKMHVYHNKYWNIFICTCHNKTKKNALLSCAFSVANELLIHAFRYYTILRMFHLVNLAVSYYKVTTDTYI